NLLERFDIAAAHAPGYTGDDRGPSEAFYELNRGAEIQEEPNEGILGASHHRCHILRKAASILRAKAPPSHNGDAARSGRKERRMSSNRPGLPASARAISTYSSTELAIKSVRPIWLSRLAPTRAAWRSPRSITTGTPIHSASQVVVVPLLGNGSSAISTRW